LIGCNTKGFVAVFIVVVSQLDAADKREIDARENAVVVSILTSQSYFVGAASPNEA